MNFRTRKATLPDRRTGFLQHSLFTCAISAIALLLALYFGIKPWVAIIGSALLLVVTLSVHHISVKVGTEEHARSGANLGLILALAAFIVQAPESVRQPSTAKPVPSTSLQTYVPRDSLDGVHSSEVLVYENESAQLTLCRLEFPDINDAENVRYRARVQWRRPPVSGIASFHIGAINPNGEFWPQVSSTTILQGQESRVDFVVSRRSTLPTRFVVVGLDRSAEAARAGACRPGRSCYLLLPQAGVFQVSNEVRVTDFVESVLRC